MKAVITVFHLTLNILIQIWKKPLCFTCSLFPTQILYSFLRPDWVLKKNNSVWNLKMHDTLSNNVYFKISNSQNTCWTRSVYLSLFVKWWWVSWFHLPRLRIPRVVLVQVRESSLSPLITAQSLCSPLVIYNLTRRTRLHRPRNRLIGWQMNNSTTCRCSQHISTGSR